MNALVDLTVSIVVTNNRAMLERCLRSIRANSGGVELEVIVVDNACTDGSGEMMRREFPEVQVLVNRERLGFAASHNRALEKGRGRYLLILNDDTEILPGCFETMVAFMDAHAEAGACGAKLLNPDETLQRTAERFPTLVYGVLETLALNWRMPNNPVRRHILYADWDRNTVRAVDAVSGAAMLVRREAMEQVGRLDEAFFIYSEEVDWCLRLHRRGWKIFYLPDARIVHYGGQSTAARAPGTFNEIHWRSFLYYYRKHFGTAVYWFLKILLEVRLSLRKLLPHSPTTVSIPK
jgi:GT2 family glycosyltransferase